ncbi:MAG: cytochrome c [Gemmataceae bacterium]
MLLGVGLLLLPACAQQMADHAGYKPLSASDFFTDGRSARPVVAGTVARGQLHSDRALYDGRDAAGELVTQYPIEVSKPVLERGRERYNVFCSVCHGLTGHGDGRVVKRGFTVPPNYVTDLSRGYKLRGVDKKLIDVPVGYIFEVITKGYGAMPDHAAQIPVPDRWAIVAYVQALQYSQSQEMRKRMQPELEKAKGGAK